MSRRYRSASAQSLDADMRADEFRRSMLEAKAPTTYRLMNAVNAALIVIPYEHPLLGALERLSIALSYDAERGAEHNAESAKYVDGLLAQIKVPA